MSLRYEFYSTVSNGQINLPDEIAARIRLKGIERLHVVVTSAAEEESLLAARGIDSATIDRVAELQKFDRDIASAVLAGEGGGSTTPLAERLKRLCIATAGEPE